MLAVMLMRMVMMMMRMMICVLPLCMFRFINYLSNFTSVLFLSVIRTMHIRRLKIILIEGNQAQRG